MKRFLSILAIAAVAAFAFTSCEDDPVEAEVALEGITVSPATLALEVGQTGTLTVAYNPENATVKPEVEWVTSDPAVATVANGTVTAVAAGTAEIIASAGKLTSKCIVTVTGGTPGPGPEPQDGWDYTPGADYAAATNLWKAVDAAHTVEWFYNPAWAGEKKGPALEFKESTYKVTIPDACPNDWNAQAWIRPSEEFKLDPSKTYTFSCTVNASTEGNFYMKLYMKGQDGSFCFHIDPRVMLEAGKDYEVKIEGFTPIADPLDLLIDFSGHEANTTFYIKDITLVETGDAPVADTWDYTPSSEYLAETNLYKAVFDGNKEIVGGLIAGDPETPLAIAEATNITKTQSTYKFTFPAATEGEWGNVNFLAPSLEQPVALKAGTSYNISVTLGATADIQKCIFSLHAFDPEAKNPDTGNLTCEGDWLSDLWGAIEAQTPKTFTTKYTPSADLANLSFTILPQFGTPAGMSLYIKDIIIEEIIPAVPAVFAGTYKVTSLHILGGLYTTKILEFKEKSWEWNSTINNEYDNLLVVNADDATVEYQAGADGAYWDYTLVADMNKLGTGALDLSHNFGQLPHEKVSLSIDATTGVVTIGGTLMAQAYLPGEYTLSNDWSGTTGSITVPEGSIALAFKCQNMPQSEYQASWTDEWLYTDFDRFVIHPFGFIMIFAKQ
ncbi:MAG: Ig-like domain-containing protein [Bacteroidales bacterium]|nr:Ig-like domain-containing protein [Bacteroidales bacterium]